MTMTIDGKRELKMKDSDLKTNVYIFFYNHDHQSVLPLARRNGNMG